MPAILQGAADVIRAALIGPSASSAEGLVVERWAERPARLARMDRLCAIALVACDAALVDAGLSPAANEWQPERTGIVLGSAWGCHATNETYYRGYLAAGVEGASPRHFAYTLPSSPVGEITIHHKILGPASTTVAGVSSVIDALREAIRHLDAGRADTMIVAAADVGTPLLASLGLPATHDGAAAIVLHRAERGRATIEATASRFIAGDPDAAMRAVIEALGAADEVYAPRTLGTRTLDERVPSVSPLLAMREILREKKRALVVTADASGQAGGAIVDARG